MTIEEKNIAFALQNCSFLPGSSDKRFVNQLSNWYDRKMTEKGREFMLKLLYKYRKQIPNHEKLLCNYNHKKPNKQFLNN